MSRSESRLRAALAANPLVSGAALDELRMDLRLESDVARVVADQGDHQPGLHVTVSADDIHSGDGAD